MTTQCKAKNPAACWKHGTGSTVTLTGAKQALKSAKAELVASEGFESYEVTRQAVDKYERRIAYLKGKKLTDFEIDLAYTEMVEDAHKEYEAVLKTQIADSQELASALVPYPAVVNKLQDETPTTIINQISPYILDAPEDIQERFKQQWTDSASTVQHWEAEGYKSVRFDAIDEEIFYFYKEDPSDSSNYGTWVSVQEKHRAVIEPADDVRESALRSAREAKSFKRFSLRNPFSAA